MKGSDQTIARDKNIEMVFHLLKNQDLSSSEMANHMGLSKAALTKIMKEMLEANYVFYNEKDVIEDRRGRRKQYFTLNPVMGIILFVNFIHQNIDINLYNLKGQILSHQSMSTNVDREEDVLTLLIDDILNLVSHYQTASTPLMSIIISAPGKVDKKKNVFKQSNMYKALESSEFAKTLEEKLHVPVYLKNDINLALHGYIKQKSIESKNTLMIYMGDSVGGAIYSNGAILEGDHGYAGEFGLMKTFDEQGNLTTVESLCSMKSLYQRIKIDQVSELINLNQMDDKHLNNALQFVSQHMAQLIHNFYQIFDFEHVCITGDIAQIKENFKSKMEERLNTYDVENTTIHLHFEHDIERLMHVGAIDLGQVSAFQTLIHHRKVGHKL